MLSQHISMPYKLAFKSIITLKTGPDKELLPPNAASKSQE